VASCFALGPASAQNIPAYITAAVNGADRPAADKMRDADRKPAESLAFCGVKPGDQVLELVGAGGYYTRLLSTIVGPTGKVSVTVPETQFQARPGIGRRPEGARAGAGPLERRRAPPTRWHTADAGGHSGGRRVDQPQLP
jgi:predicted methyltransferase